MNKNRLIVMAGGTGGHIFPGLTVANHLMLQDWQVRWLGTADHMEADLVPRHGIEIDFIQISGLRGKNLKSFLATSINVFKSLHKAHNLMKAWKPNVVLGMGGYVSGPGGLAAWSCGIPVIIHEQNSIAGLTNKLLEKLATKVIQAFPGAFQNADVVGNPIRSELLTMNCPKQRLEGREGPIRILVLGGSQGAHVLNQILPQVAGMMKNSIIIWHQTGKGNRCQVMSNYKKVGQTQHKISEFINDIATAYAWADLVVCRSGALTVTEVATVGLPAIFVPFPHKDRQQYWNAMQLEKIGAACIFKQSEFTANKVVETLRKWNRTILLKMAQCARQIAIPDSTERVAEILRQYIL